MTRREINPALVESLRAIGVPNVELRTMEVWANDTYQATVTRRPDGIVHISLKRHDRRAVRDWRHLQSIKNEIAGPEATAVELFPPESKLADTANEYHLWVLPDDHELVAVHGGTMFGADASDRLVFDHSETNAGRVAGEHLARQRPFQPGLSTGKRQP
jgi:hypothetical protein